MALQEWGFCMRDGEAARLVTWTGPWDFSIMIDGHMQPRFLRNLMDSNAPCLQQFDDLAPEHLEIVVDYLHLSKHEWDHGECPLLTLIMLLVSPSHTLCVNAALAGDYRSCTKGILTSEGNVRREFTKLGFTHGDKSLPTNWTGAWVRFVPA